MPRYPSGSFWRITRFESGKDSAPGSLREWVRLALMVGLSKSFAGRLDSLLLPARLADLADVSCFVLNHPCQDEERLARVIERVSSHDTIEDTAEAIWESCRGGGM